MTTNLIKVHDTSMMRDINSLGLVETDKRKIAEYQSRKKFAQNSKELTGRVTTMEGDIKEIKDALAILLERIQKV